MDFPYYSGVPKDFKANLKWRKKLLRKAANEPAFAEAVRKMCADDVLFYINGFVWTKDPRDQKMPVKPFITYQYQDDAIAGLVYSVDKGLDVAWPKSRTMGASWKGLTFIEWKWHFHHDLDFGLVSRKQEYVDSPGDPKCLFWKIDFIHENQPNWLLPTGRWLGSKDPNRTHLKLVNHDTRSTISGEATTGNMFRGSRLTMLFVDEMAAFEINDGYKALSSTRDTTHCRVFNSTYQGTANAFYEITHNSAARVFEMHWTKHPIYKKGLYTSEKVSGFYRLKVIDEECNEVVETIRKEWGERREFKFPEEYPFILDGKMRSPWYDAQCARCATKQEIAQEIDMNPQGSVFQFFDPSFINMLIAEYCIPAEMKGRLLYNPETMEPIGFEKNENSPLSLWFNISGDDSLGLFGDASKIKDIKYFKNKRFGIGADVSMGTGASNSAASVVDLDTGRKVALWKDPHTEPGKFADEVVALCRWFNDAKLIWDGSGPTGRAFTQRVIDIPYGHLYYRKDEEKFRSHISDQPGYYLNPEDRAIVMRDYREALEKREFINVSESGMRETLEFVVEPGGKVEHTQAANSQDPSGAKSAHGDEAIADALASRLMNATGSEPKQAEIEAPWMSPAWRFAQEERELAEAAIQDW